MYQLAEDNAIKELVLQTFQYEKELESMQQIDSNMKNTFQLSFDEHISKELLKERGRSM